MSTIEPFIRWAGGKTWLVPFLPGILNHIPFRRYHEPFLGGGAVFFALEHQETSFLSDANAQLINTYIHVKRSPEEVIALFQEMPNTKDDYYRIRSEITTENTVENAARFIYLNQTSFNGIYRVNRDGKYNVPYGFRKTRKHQPERIRAASIKLRNAEITVGDFESHKDQIEENDLVFLDPPYTVSHNNNGFIQYNRNLFSLDDQYRLKGFIEYIKHQGAYYILTNAAHSTIRDIFLQSNDRIIEQQRCSLIGGKHAAREKITEYLFTNIPEAKHE